MASRVKIILEKLVSARMFYRSKFPALYSLRNRLEKSTRKFHSNLCINFRADTSRSDIITYVEVCILRLPTTTTTKDSGQRIIEESLHFFH